MSVNRPARPSPGARILAAISRLSSSLGRDLYKVVGQRLDLLGLEGLVVVVGHDAVLEALGHLGARVLDRLLDEGGVLALEDLAQVGADRALRARVGERVAGPTGRLHAREERLAVRRRAAAAAAARGLLAAGRLAARPALGPQVGEPLVELARGHDVGALAHDGVPEAAQLGAHDGERAGLGRRD